MGRYHFDTVLTIVSGKVVPYIDLPDNVASIQAPGQDGLSANLTPVYRALSYMCGRQVFTHDIPECLPKCSIALCILYPELSHACEFPLEMDKYEEWRAAFLAEHGMEEWFDLPVITEVQ